MLLSKIKRWHLLAAGGALLLAALILTATMLMSSSTAAVRDADGYIMITTPAELDAIRNGLKDKYRLYADIDLTGYVSAKNTADKGWYPIAHGSKFKGELDGNGHAIRGLWSKWSIAHVGLFSELDVSLIKNLDIYLAPAGMSGKHKVGALVGIADDGIKIDNVNVYGGKIITTTGGYAGGLIGRMDGVPYAVVTNCTVNGTYIESDENYAGGIVGCMEDKSQMVDCAAIDVTVKGHSYIGGIAGAIHDKSWLNRVYTSGTVTAEKSYAGGIVGSLYGESAIYNGYATANVNSMYYAGGVAGIIHGYSTLSKSCAYGNVTTTKYISGGLVGEALNAIITNTYAQGNVKGTTGVGGLVGFFSDSSKKLYSLENSYSSGTVTGTGTTEYGAFAGRNHVVYYGTNYYNSDTAGVARATGTAGTPSGAASARPQARNTMQMKQQANFVGWDFNTIWHIDEGITYPYFIPYWDSGTRPANVDLSVTGQLKVNRKITAQGIAISGDPNDYANEVNGKTVTLVITPISGSPTLIHIDTTTARGDYNDFLVTEPGDYLLTFTVTDGTHPTIITKTITVEADTPPIGSLDMNGGTYQRDSTGNVTIPLIGSGSSPDGDPIKYVWTIIHDSNNDGVFNETPITVESFDAATSFASNEVGMYKIELKIIEVLEPIPGLLDAGSNTQTDCGSVIIEITNQAPNVLSGAIYKGREVDLVVTLGDLSTSRRNDIIAAINSIKNEFDNPSSQQDKNNPVKLRIIGLDTNYATLDTALDALSVVSGRPIVVLQISDGASPAGFSNAEVGNSAARLLGLSAKYVVGGSNALYMGISNAAGGTTIDSSNIYLFTNSLRSILLERANELGLTTSVTWFAADDPITFSFVYSDPENDPSADIMYRLVHNPSLFNPNQGTSDINNTWVSQISYLQKSGQYDLFVTFKDAPSTNPVLNAAYSRTMNGEEFWFGGTRVHNRPIAIVSVSLDSSNPAAATFTAIEASYDIDFQYEAGQGITEVEWKWKSITSGTWNYGKPATLPYNDDYVVTYRVQDAHGRWSDTKAFYLSTFGL